MSNYINTLSKYRMSDGWAAHRARGSLGGIDYAVPVGTPIPAPCDGRLVNVKGNGSGGWYAEFYHADGSHDEFLHLSKFAKPGSYKQGQIIGWSGGKVGAPGAGSSTGPHIHWHYILRSGTRVNPLDYVAGGKKPMPDATAPQANGWKGMQKYLKKHYGYTGAIDGIDGTQTWLAMQTFMKAHYGYKGSVDGVPGPQTWKAVQTWLKKYFGYEGVIDGAPGGMTYAALARAGAKLASA